MKKILLLIFFLSIILSSISCLFLSASNETVHEKASSIMPDEALKIVELFYDELLNDTAPSECKDLFDNSMQGNLTESQKQNQKTEQWVFLKNNKDLFVSERFIDNKFFSRKDYFAQARKGFLYFNPPQGRPIEEGWLFITLSTVINRGEDSIWKDIAFPVDIEPETNKIKIEFYGIRINGVFIYPETPKNFDLFNTLGFHVESKDEIETDEIVSAHDN